MVSIVFFGLSFLPVIGPLVIPAAQFLLVSSPLFGLKASVAVVIVLTFVPGAKAAVTMFVGVCLASRSLARELMEPYLTRMHQEPVERRRFINRNSARLLGFALPYTFLIGIPVVGPFVWVIAQVSV